MIADFSGMLPLRDPILLPDNNAQLASNCWLYRGQVRGFRSATEVYTTLYGDTQQVYRIPLNDDNPPDFTAAGSLWLEFPDPYMATIRNPTVGDQFNRYYFFPSDKYAANGSNPNWPNAVMPPQYNTLDNLMTGRPGYTLGIPTPDTPPTVAPAPMSAVIAASAATAPGDTVLHFASSPAAQGVLVGMEATDLTTTDLYANSNAAAVVGASTLSFASTAGLKVGMTIQCLTNPPLIFPGTQITYISGGNVTINSGITQASPSGDYFQFEASNAIPSGTTVKAISGNDVTLSGGVRVAGVLSGDQIQFYTALPESRAYVYTYVNDFSEEGPPSPATVATGDPTGMWTVVIPAPPAGYADGLAMTPGHWRLYRTVTDSSGNATYYQVAEVPINPSGTVTVYDSALDENITSNLILSTIGYSGPPDGLQGVVMMANGIAAGFTNQREVWFSAAYLPYAWPAAYALTVDYPIVGLTANGTSLNIITEGSPFIATGVTPDTMTIGKITANEPCISRGSIVAAGEGAYYASPNGIQLLNTGGTQNITIEIYEKEFHYSLSPEQWAAGKYGSSYMSAIKGTPIPSPDGVGFYGFVIDNAVTNVPFTYLRFPIEVVNLYSDELSGQLFGLMSNHTVMQWNPPEPLEGPGLPADTTKLRPWQWKTKKFRFTAPQQFKAFIVLFTVPDEVTFTLGVRNTDQGQIYDPTSQYLIIRVYADGRQVVVREVQVSGETILIPGGFKAELWEFEFEGIVGMRFFKVASSVKELKAA